MKTKQFYFGMLMALVAMTFIACSSSDEATEREQGTELKISAGITAQKTSYDIGEWGTNIDIGNVDTCYSKESLYKPYPVVTRTPVDGNNWEGMIDRNIAVKIGSETTKKCTINATGNITMPNHYYFLGMSNVSLKSWYPYSSSLATFSVKADQTTYANYEASDLMYASMEINQSSPNVGLRYSHKTVKIIFNVTINNSHYLYSPKIKAVTLSNVYTTGNVSNGNLTSSGSKGSVKMYNFIKSSTSANNVTTATFEACLIPQSTAISYNIEYGAGSYSGTLSSKTLSSGNEYTVNVTMNVLEYADLGLSVKWARVNMGGVKAVDYGDYYQWGATNNYLNTYLNELYYKGDEDIVAGGPYDTARQILGSPWCMPDSAQAQELIDRCVWEWTAVEGHPGYIVTSKTKPISIFLPAAGSMINADHQDFERDGRYWVTNKSGSAALKLYFDMGSVFVNGYSRSYGFSIRAIRK